MASGTLPTFPGSVPPVCKMGTPGDMAQCSVQRLHRGVSLSLVLMLQRASETKCAVSDPQRCPGRSGGGSEGHLKVALGASYSAIGTGGDSRRKAPLPLRSGSPAGCRGLQSASSPSCALPADRRLLGSLPLEGSLWLSEPDSAHQMFSIFHFLCFEIHIWNLAQRVSD